MAWACACPREFGLAMERGDVFAAAHLADGVGGAVLREVASFEAVETETVLSDFSCACVDRKVRVGWTRHSLVALLAEEARRVGVGVGVGVGVRLGLWPGGCRRVDGRDSR